MAIMGDFIKLKISLLFMILFSLFVSSCISFSEEKEMLEFINRNCTIKWIDEYGILDQTPYSYLIIDSCGKKDTISIYNQIENIVVNNPNSIVYMDDLSAEESKSEIDKMISYGLIVQIVNTPKRCYEKFNNYLNNKIDYLLMDYQEITDIILIKEIGEKEIVFSINFPNEMILLITLYFEDKELCQSLINKKKCDKYLFFNNKIIIKKITVLNKDSVIISLPYNNMNGELYGEDRIRYIPQ